MLQNTGETSVLGGALISSQVVDRLLYEMREGCYACMKRLPAEVELASSLGVSRTVVRDALSEMEREGFVERVRGIGTVINHRALTLKNRMDQKFEYSTMIRAAGCTPNIDLVTTRRISADALLAQALAVEQGSPVLEICKRVKGDDKPVIYSVDCLPAELFGRQKLEKIDFSAPIFDILERECNQVVTSTVTHVKAVCPNSALRRTMELGTEDALLVLEEVGCTRLCVPVLYSYSYYTDFFDFSLLRKLF